MKRLIGTLAILALAMGALMTMAAAPAFAASACASQTTLTSSSATSAGGGTVTLTDTVKDCNGVAQAGVQVTFSQSSGPCASKFSSATGTTNASGQASVTVTLPAGCPGNYVFTAGANGVNATTTVVETGGFPATAADPAEADNGLPIEPLLLLGVGLLMVISAGTAVLIRRRS